MSNTADVVIKVPNGPSALGTVVTVNGQAVAGVEAISFIAKAERPVKVWIEILPSSVRVEGHVELSQFAPSLKEDVS